MVLMDLCAPVDKLEEESTVVTGVAAVDALRVINGAPQPVPKRSPSWVVVLACAAYFVCVVLAVASPDLFIWFAPPLIGGLLVVLVRTLRIRP